MSRLAFTVRRRKHISYDVVDIRFVGRACTRHIIKTFCITSLLPSRTFDAWINELAPWVTQVIKSSELDVPVVILSMILLSRQRRFRTGRRAPDIKEAKKAFICSLIVASKVVCDGRKRIEFWSRASLYLFPVEDLKKAEVEFCMELGWNLQAEQKAYNWFAGQLIHEASCGQDTSRKDTGESRDVGLDRSWRRLTAPNCHAIVSTTSQSPVTPLDFEFNVVRRNIACPTSIPTPISQQVSLASLRSSLPKATVSAAKLSSSASERRIRQLNSAIPAKTGRSGRVDGVAAADFKSGPSHWNLVNQRQKCLEERYLQGETTKRLWKERILETYERGSL